MRKPILTIISTLICAMSTAISTNAIAQDLDSQQLIQAYTQESTENFMLCKAGKLTTVEFATRQNEALKKLLDAKLIDNKAYQDAITEILKRASECAPPNDANDEQTEQNQLQSNTANPSNATGFTPEELQEINNEFKSLQTQCETSQITITAWRAQRSAIIEKFQAAGKLSAEEYKSAYTGLSLDEKNCVAVRKLKEISTSCYNKYEKEKLGIDGFNQCLDGNFSKLVQDGYITEENKKQYIDYLDNEIYKNELNNQLLTLQSKCETNEMKIDETLKKQTELIVNALNKQIISEEDYKSYESQFDLLQKKCSAFQSYHQHNEACYKQSIEINHPYSEYEKCLSDELSELVRQNYITEEAKQEQLKKARDAHSNSSKSTSLSDEWNDLTTKYSNGNIQPSRARTKSIEILQESKDKGLITDDEYKKLYATIPNEDDYIAMSPAGQFELRIGLTAGVILDDSWQRSTLPDDPLASSTFWPNRGSSSTDLLSQFGFSAVLGYVWWFIGFYIQQEFSGGWWVGDVDDSDKSQIFGMTFLVFRMQYSFDSIPARLAFDLGIGAAYSVGDDRENREQSGYRKPYIFDNKLDPGTEFAAKVGITFDYFVTPRLAIGIKFDYNYIDNYVNLPSKFDQYMYYSDPEISHTSHYFQPGIQLTYAFPIGM